jgi:hypothetical protein
MYDRLAAFRRAHPLHWPRITVAQERALAKWCIHQRHLWKKKRLSPEREKQLLRLGFITSPKRGLWNRRFQEVQAWRSMHHKKWPSGSRGEGKTLADWCRRQRSLHAEGKLSAEQTAYLTRAGFSWDLPAPGKRRQARP